MRSAPAGDFYEGESGHPVRGIISRQVRPGRRAGRRGGTRGHGGPRTAVAGFHLGGFRHAEAAGLATAASTSDPPWRGADRRIRIRRERRDEARRAALDAAAGVDLAVPAPVRTEAAWAALCEV